MGKWTSVRYSSLRLRDLRSLHSASLPNFWTFTLATTLGQWQRRRVCASSERQKAIEEAPRRGAWRPSRMHGVSRFSLHAYTGAHHDRCIPEVAVASHRHPLSSSRCVACSSSGSQVARRLPGRHSSVTASALRCRTGLSCGAQRLGETATLVPSRWVFCPKALAGHL